MQISHIEIHKPVCVIIFFAMLQSDHPSTLSHFGNYVLTLRRQFLIFKLILGKLNKQF